MSARRPGRAGKAGRGIGRPVLLCRMGWHRWIVLPLQEPDYRLERVCLRCGRRERLVADRWGLSLDWQEPFSRQ